MNAGESPAESRAVVNGAPVRLQKAVPRSKENAAVERREVNALRTGVRRKAFELLPAPFGAPLPHIVRGFSPREPRGWKLPAHPAPYENRGGGALVICSRTVECE